MIAASKKTRIGLIELGSRSARYLVMDIQFRVQHFEAVQIKTVLHGLDPTALREGDVDTINRLVTTMKTDLAAHKCDIEYVYGTELCRVIESQRPGELVNFLRVLSSGHEAAAAWASAFLCLDSDEQEQSLTVVDLGNGSTQVARGSWTGSKIAGLKTASVPIGSSLLMNHYVQNSAGFARFAEDQSALVERELHQAGIELERSGSLYLVGGVATKIGWLNVRRHPSDVYEPERVNGVAVPLPILDEFFARAHSEYRQSPEKVVRLIDAREGSEREAVRVISGSAYLAKLVRVLHTTSTPRVTGYGVRHGIAFLLLHGLLAA